MAVSPDLLDVLLHVINMSPDFMRQQNNMAAPTVCVLVGLFTVFGFAFGNDNFKKPLFSTKTPYFWVQNEMEIVQDNAFSTTTHNDQACEIEGLNLLFRHGARYPTLKWIRRFTQLHLRLITDSSVVQNFPNIVNWRNPFHENEEGFLSELGENEMKTLGERFAKRFKVLLDGKIEDIKFAVTYKERTKSSYTYFYQGLNKTFPEDINKPEAKEENVRLRFYEYCNKYIKEVDDNDAILNEFEAFEDGTEVKDIVEKVNNKFGNSTVVLDIDDVMIIQQLCALELGLYKESIWCQFLDLTDLEVIDYMEDIEEYAKVGNAYTINWKQTCPFTSYMFKRFDQAIQHSGQSNLSSSIDITFGHQDTILPVFTALQLFKDTNSLDADGFLSNKNRKFRTSKITPFSANIAIGLYKCGGNDHAVKIYANEEEMTIPSCGKTVCSYTNFKQFYKQLAICNFDEICENDTSSSTVIKAYTGLICILALIISLRL